MLHEFPLLLFLLARGGKGGGDGVSRTCFTSRVPCPDGDKAAPRRGGVGGRGGGAPTASTRMASHDFAIAKMAPSRATLFVLHLVAKLSASAGLILMLPFRICSRQDSLVDCQYWINWVSIKFILSSASMVSSSDFQPSGRMAAILASTKA